MAARTIAEDPPASIDILNSLRNESPSLSEHASHLAQVAPHCTTTISSTERACRRLIRYTLERPSLIEAILSSKDEEEATRSLPLEDAQILALNSSDLSPPVRKKTIGLLYRTCEHHAVVPSALAAPADYDRTSDRLYRGGYADVWRSQHSGRDVAVKAIRLYSKHVSQKVINKFCKLAVMWRSLQHPNLVPLVGVTMSETRFAMVSHWMANGNISAFIKANPEADKLGLLADTAEGLIYLHSNGMVHGDLKGLNILIDETCHARLADFGLLTIVSDPAHLISSSSHGQGSTIRWMSPELIAPEKFGLSKGCPTKSSDCYALGMVIYETISGGIPFHECIETVVYVKVMLGEHPSRCAVFPEDLWKMMELCWMFQPDGRPNITDVLWCLRANSSESPRSDDDTEIHGDDQGLSNSSLTIQSTKSDAITAERSIPAPVSSYAADHRLRLVSSPPRPHQPAWDPSPVFQSHYIPLRNLQQGSHPQIPRQTMYQEQMVDVTMGQDYIHDYPYKHDPNPSTSCLSQKANSSIVSDVQLCKNKYHDYESNQVHAANVSNNQTFHDPSASPELVTPLEISANRWTRGPKANQEQNVERKVTALLNKLTMERFDSISDQIIAWANKSETEKDGRTLIHVIRLVFEKATDEAAWSEMYARLCRKMMETISFNVQDNGIRNAEGKPIAGGQLFRKYLLNRCQEDFERGWAAKDIAASAAAAKAFAEASGEAELYSDEYYVAQKAKQRRLGLIQFIGELYKLQMLTERIMHECIKKLFGNVDNPKEEEIESLCRLLTTIGKLLDNPKARAHMDIYFTRMKELGKSSNVSPGMQLILQDLIELRERKWIPRNRVAGPTTIAQVHEEAAKQRAQAEKEAANLSLAMSRGGFRRGGGRGAGPAGEQQAEGWSVAGESASRPPPRAGDLSNFGKINKPGPVVMGPSSVWAGKKDAAKRDSTLTRVNSSSNMFMMLGRDGEAMPEISLKPSRPSSRKPQPRKLQLLPRSILAERNGVNSDTADSSDDGGGDETPRAMFEGEANKKIAEYIKEFFLVRNIDESEEYFTKLPPEHHHLLVDKIVSKAIESKEADGKLVAAAFARAAKRNLCSASAFEEGFWPVAELLDDTAIDAPKAFQIMAIMMKGAGLDKDEERRSRIVHKSMDSDKLLRLLA